ncbi:MAG TPA: hypothetical protein VIG45_06805 [Erysipelothrix sp.]
MKKKLVKKNLFAKWEIISTAEIVENEYKGKPIDDAFFSRVYGGNFVRLYRDGRTEAKQVWSLEIVTTAKDDEGVIHTHEVEWTFDKPMTIREVLGGAKHIKMNSGGIKTRWVGVTKQWLDTVDQDLKGMDAIEAWATAKCTAMVKPKSAQDIMADALVNKLVDKYKNNSLVKSG